MALAYKMITSKAALEQLIAKIAGQLAAFDFETTSLRPDTGRVRLASICNAKTRAIVDFDAIPGGFAKHAHLFRRCSLIVFNAGFESRWFLAACPDKMPEILDVQNLRRAIMGGSAFSLARMAEWDLKLEISKAQQLSDWSAKKLTKEQLDYAYGDADVTWRLWVHWSERADDGRWKAFKLFNDMEVPVIEMEEAGMLLDQQLHSKLVKKWLKIQEEQLAKLRELVGPDEVANVNSDTQWSDYFSKLMPDAVLNHWPRTDKSGLLSMKSSVLKHLAGQFTGSPLETFFDALSDYKRISKYVSSFGDTLITKAKASADGRVRARYNIAAAITGRFSSSGPNLQQIPRDKSDFFGDELSIRASFIAPKGRKLVSLDYSGIELRVLALLTGDKQLLDDLLHGDIHATVASFIHGRKITKADKEERSGAKPVSFGIIYGAGASGLSATLRTIPEKAQSYIDYWATRYPKAFRLRHDKQDEAQRTQYIRMVDGGTIWMGKRADLPKCANYPVQRAALSIMARAITRHKATLDAQRAKGRLAHTRMLSTIHDALIDEASSRDAKPVLKLMKKDMELAYLDIFPGAPTGSLVEGGIGQSWGSLEDVAV